MRSIPVSIQAALEARSLVTRDFMRITARDRVTGELKTEGFWSGVRGVRAWAIDPETAAAVEYDFSGAGSLISTDPIPAVSNMTVQRVTVNFSLVEDRINELLRTYSLKNAPIVIWRGIFDPDTMTMVEAAQIRFVGFVDGAPTETPAEGQEGAIALECVSHAQELTRSNPDLRSHESQIIRAPGDDFLKDVATVGDIQIFWGAKSGVVATA
jgi:hypothetical protein